MRLAIANDMKKIRENITATQQERKKKIEDMRENVGDMLKTFQMEHNQMAVDLKISLKEFNNERIAISNTFMGEMVTQIRDLRSDVMSSLGDYGSDMAEAKNIWVSLTGPQKSIKPRTVAPKKEATIKEPTQVAKAVKGPTQVRVAVKAKNPNLKTRRKTQT